LGTYCEYHQRHHRHHRHHRLLPRSEKEEEKKPLESQKSRRAKGSSKAASEFSNFMSISSGLSDTDKAGSQPPEMGNLVVCSLKLIETITLPIAIGNWHYSRSRVIGNVVDSITEPRKNNCNYFL
jgi:hypothetical protein